MGIRDTMQPSFGKLFDTTFAELMTPFTGSYLGPGVYDPVSETTTAHPVTYTGRGVSTKFKRDQIDNDRILATDTLLIVLTNEVTDTPQAGHDVVARDLVSGLSAKYRIEGVVTDPARVHFQIQLRAT
ncbi:hypothetical protein B1F77_26905 [Pseudomonas syringae]|uniref:Uncharacterized protein n=1 Tax=Pseudomonas syringae TaxID=317 RepID=A0AB37ZPQ1_PSESX|nr:hypothetical protein [Pseudomonas syringae]RXT72250.1 hypothetical protein B1F77_26905 [Pseudomonas syringae]RXT85336.1 hypothetical protein B1F72_13805 [Pseudomonas syringae]SDN47308.1 hypothetical protein SAMN05444505_108178 [Pseudomonas syringae]